MSPAHPGPTSHATSWRPDEEGRRYELGRPDYPQEAVALLAAQLGLRPGARVLDIAAGTGKLTRLLTGTGAAVVAVEPMPGMRSQLVHRAPGGAVVAGRAEQLGVRTASVDAVTVAQAFHWFDVSAASRELRRVLRPGGRLALVTNRRDARGASQAQLWDVLRRYEALAPRPGRLRDWRADLAATGDFGSFERFEVPNAQRFATREAFDARFASISFVILLDEADRRDLLRELHEVVDGVEAPVVPLLTEIEVATRRD